MNILFLGTGAAEAMKIPEKEIIGNMRRCTSVLLDERVIVDLALQSYDYVVKLGVKTEQITDIFLSHTHSDHYQKEVLLAYARATKVRLNLWCHKNAVSELKFSGDDEKWLQLCPIESMQTWETAGMRVTALPANHLVEANPDEQPLHYIFEKDGKCLFYGCDGGRFLSKAWEYMRRNCVFYAMILETTVRECQGNFRIGTHNTLPMVRLLLTALRENGMLRESPVLIGTHINGTYLCL